MSEVRETCAPVAVAILLSAALTSTAIAQLAPRAGYVFPPGGRAGTTVEVRLGGFDFTRDMQYFVHDERLAWEVRGELSGFYVPPPPYWFGPKGRSSAMPIPREISATIRIPADMSAGPVYWQVANANGISSTAIFVIGHDEEILENRYRQEPQGIDRLPVVVSGRLLKIAEVDRYQIRARQDGPVTVELAARQIGSNFHGVLKVVGQDGQHVADIADTEGLDIDLTFVARAGEVYTVELHDLDFRGNRSYVYRLHFRPGPRVLKTVPAAVRRGTTQRVEFSGFGLISGTDEWESVQREVTAPDHAPLGEFTFPFQTATGVAPVALLSSDLEEQRESELEPAAEGGLELKVPGAVTGECRERALEKRFQISVEQGAFLTIAVESRAVGGGLDVALQVLDTDGKELAKNDDAGGTTDAQLEWQPPKSGRYTLVVRGLSSGRTDTSDTYRLSVRRRQPGFGLTGPQQLLLPIGGKAELVIKAVRYAGFKEAIRIRIDGLPAGISVPNDLTIKPDQGELKIPLETVGKTACAASLIKVTGMAVVDGTPLSVSLQTGAGGNLCPRRPGAHRLSRVLLATTMTAPFNIDLIGKNRQRAVHRGTTYPAPLEIKRDAGFKGQVMLQMAANQSRHRQGISGPRMTVAADQSRVFYPCFMPEWLETDRTTRMTIMGLAWVPDPLGTRRLVTKATNGNVTMILEGALLKVSCPSGMLMLRPEESRQMSVRVLRSAKLPAAVELALVAPADLDGRVSAAPVIVPVGTDEAVLVVRAGALADRIGDHPLRIRATALQGGKWPAVSEAELLLRVLPPATE